jgi:hypothetical protein
MIIKLTGRLDDGSDLTDGLPAWPATPIKVMSRTDVIIRLQVLNPQGVRYTSADFTSMQLTVREQLLGASALLKLTGAANVQNQSWDFTIPAASLDGAKIPPGLYAYDVWCIRDTKRDVVMPISAFHVVATMGASS